MGGQIQRSGAVWLVLDPPCCWCGSSWDGRQRSLRTLDYQPSIGRKLEHRTHRERVIRAYPRHTICDRNEGCVRRKVKREINRIEQGNSSSQRMTNNGNASCTIFTHTRLYSRQDLWCSFSLLRGESVMNFNRRWKTWEKGFVYSFKKEVYVCEECVPENPWLNGRLLEDQNSEATYSSSGLVPWCATMMVSRVGS
jgi:hypothetical protein